MWTNKQHIMSRLAKEHEVLYVDFTPRPALRAVRTLRGFREPTVRKEGNVTVLGFYAPSIVHALRHGNPLRVFGQFDLRLRLLEQYLREHDMQNSIVWVYHPGYGAGVDRLPRKLLVYDCVDEYTAFPEFGKSKRWIAERERALCQLADVVFCTAPALLEAKRRYNPEHTHLVHNVGDAEHFAKTRAPETPVAKDIASLARPVIGFIGAVSDYKLNTDWLLQLAEARPDWSVAIVGPVGIADPNTDLSKLEELPNVHLLGHREYGVLPQYLKGFDVAVIPYRINDYTRSVFPIKFFEMMASGKPVVISALPALERYFSSALVARDATEFIQCCERALSDTGEARAERIALAERNSWPARIRQLMEHIETRLAEQ